MSEIRPGTRVALDRGCLCPVIDNNRGEYPPMCDENGGALWWRVEDCPIHQPEETNL